MPIYEYECPKCGRFEVVQKADARPLKAKPDCDESSCPKKAARVMSAPAFHLKGSGWYKTDYSSGGATASAGKKSKAGGATESTEKKSADSTADAPAKEAAKDTKPKGGCGSGSCSCD